MTRLLVAAMPGEIEPARRLAALLGVDVEEVKVHRFPDGESLVRAPRTEATTAIYCSLDKPNAKLVELMLAASALREQGARRLILVAPYLCYMRQDASFHQGEAVSQRVIGKFLAERFDRLITVEPHLHRTGSLTDVFVGREATALSAASLLARAIRCDGIADSAVIVGPDKESRPWTEEIAGLLNAPLTVLAKTRRADREVFIAIDPVASIEGRVAYLIDDIASTGNTLATAARALVRRGAARIEAIVVHALCSADDVAQMRMAGVARFRSTDTVAHSSNEIAIAPLLASALEGEAQ
jgi:ribose-phosphate pyrophosphokinase